VDLEAMNKTPLKEKGKKGDSTKKEEENKHYGIRNGYRRGCQKEGDVRGDC
jgi:hypothetical protein